MTSDCEAGGHLKRGRPTWETHFSIADHLFSVAWPLFQNKFSVPKRPCAVIPQLPTVSISVSLIPNEVHHFPVNELKIFQSGGPVLAWVASAMREGLASVCCVAWLWSESRPVGEEETGWAQTWPWLSRCDTETHRHPVTFQGPGLCLGTPDPWLRVCLLEGLYF